jgi:hypothetical protein
MASFTHGFASANPGTPDMLYTKHYRPRSIARHAAKAALSPTISRVWVGERPPPHPVGEDGGGQCNDKQYYVAHVRVCAP